MKTLKMLLAASIASISLNTNAGWVCFAHNSKGQIWQGAGETRELAENNAKDVCSKKSEIPHDCEVKKCAE